VVYGESGYQLIQFLLLKGIALTYLIAFSVALRQYCGLVGEKGVLPLQDFVEQRSFWKSASIFHVFPSDRAIQVSAWTGIILSVSVLFGLPSSISPVFSSLSLFVLWLLFLSFVNTGQKFYEHGWELILLETGFLAIFLGGIETAASEVMVWLFRWVLFRMMLGSGIVKLHGDRAWKNLSALKYHYETQPFPNPLSWYLNKLPDKILASGVLFTHFMLLLVPFLYFAPQPYASIAGALTILYQVMIFVGGNYAWLNLITTVLAFSTFSDEIIFSVIPGLFSQPEVAAYPYGALPVILAGIVALFSFPVLKNMLSSDQDQNRSFDCLHLVNSYGAFTEVPRERKEIVLECTAEENPDEDDWKEYSFYEKPGDPYKRPVQVSPYHHRLDYPFWFTARYKEDTGWLEKLCEKLVSGSNTVENLFQKVPLREPEKVRARIFSYRFTASEERAETGKWWIREPVETLLEEDGKA
jgi:hypothetical protein